MQVQTLKCLSELEIELITDSAENFRRLNFFADGFSSIKPMNHRRRRIFTGVLAITALCTQYTAVLMSTPAQSSPKAIWNENEITSLIAYLHDHKSETEGTGNFKDPIWNGAAEHIASLLTRGPTKTSKMCYTKWVSVCSFPTNTSMI